MTAKLKSDHLGFLVGTPAEIGSALKIWGDIRDDVAAIRSGLGKAGDEAHKVVQVAARQAANDAIQKIARPRLKSNAVAVESLSKKSFTKSDSRGVHGVAAYSGNRSSDLDASGRFVSKNAKPNEEVVSAIRESATSAKQVAEKANRDAHGRFMKGRGAEKSNVDPERENKKRGVIDRMGGHLGAAMSEVRLEQMQEADPALLAANELNSILSPLTKVASPIGRGLGRMMKSGYGQLKRGDEAGGLVAATDSSDRAIRVEKRKVSLLDRIFGALVDLKTGEEKQSKETLKRLAALGDRTQSAGGQSGGFMGGIGAALLSLLTPLFAPLLNLLRMIPVIGKLISSLGGLGGGTASPRAAKGGGLWSKTKSALGFGAVAGAAVATDAVGDSLAPLNGAGTGGGAAKPASKLQRLAGGAGKFLKKIPLLGVALTLGGMAMDANATENDDTLSADEKTDQHVTNVSKTAGSLGGAATGAATGAALGSVIPIVGTAIGGVIGGFIGSGLGEIVGGLVGGWVNDLRKSDIAKNVVDGWNATTGMISDGWSMAVSGMSGAWDASVSTVTGWWDTGIKKITGLFDDVVKGISDTFGSVVGAVKSFFKETFNIDIDAALDKAKEVTGNVVTEISDGAANAQKYIGEKVDAASKFVSEQATIVAEAGVKVVEEVKDKTVAVAAKIEEVAVPVIAEVKETAGKAGNALANTRAGKVAIEAGGAISSGIETAIDFTKGIFGNGSRGNRRKVIKQMASAGITDANEQAMFLAQMHHESSGFKKLSESLNYNPKTFLNKYGKRTGFTTVDQAKAILSQGEEAIANAMYGGAWGKKNLGNTEDGDALKFKGRGFIQLTGRDNYARAGKALGLDLVSHPELAEDPDVAAKIATWYWNDRKDSKKNGETRLSDYAKAGDVNEATRLINGGKNGLEERTKLFGDYQTALAGGGEHDLNGGNGKVLTASVPPALTVLRPAVISSPVAIPSMAQVPKMPTVRDVPDMPISSAPLNPLGSSKPVAVNVIVDKGDVGQDVQDRRIAHISSGGISF